MSAIEQAPTFSSADAQALLRERFGIEGELSLLPSERDQNFRVDAADKRRYVLKIANAAEDEAQIDAQCQVLSHLANRLDVCPRLHQARNGEMRVRVRGGAGREHWIRLVDFIDGVPFGSLPAVTSRLRYDLGARLGQLDAALLDFHHPATHRTFYWDLARGAEIVRDRLQLLDGEIRRWVEALLAAYEDHTIPLLPRLRRSVIHGDANDFNVLADAKGTRIVGIVDFGDMVHSFTIADLAIAAAYAMCACPEPLDALADVVSGYAGTFPLGGVEIDAVWGLAVLRLCASAAIAAEQQRVRPDDPYLAISQATIRRTLPKLLDRPFVMAAEVVKAACDPATPFQPDSSADDPAHELRELTAARTRRIGPSVRLSYGHPLHLGRGFGQYLFARDGRRYLDAYNNVPHVGHSHPRVVAAAVRQMRLLNTNTRYLYRSLTRYAERLAATLPAPLEACYLVNSGSEANELALRIAEAATGARDVLVMEGAYHGHTSSLIDVSPYKHAGPGGRGRPDWVHVVALPDTYRGAFRREDQDAGAKYASLVDQALGRLAAEGRRPRAFLAETCPSVGGQIMLPRGYLERVYRSVRAAGGVCIADEVQTGLGRLGDVFYAFQDHGVVPDIVVLGKPLGNGLPLAAVVTTRHLAEAFDTGMEFFATFGGNPVSCEAGLAVLDVLEDEGLVQNAQQVGAILLDGLRDLAARHAIVGDVRGRGFFLGVELVSDRDTREPATREAARVKNALRDAGVLIGTDGLKDNVLKIRPPLSFDRRDADVLLGGLARILPSVSH